MELFLQLLKLYGGAILGYGFIYFVALRLWRTSNYKKMALRSSIVGLILSVLTFGGIVYDAIRNNSFVVNYSFTEPYYVFINTIVLMTIIISLVFFLLGFRRKQKFVSFKQPKQEASKPTINDYKDNIVVVFMHNNNFLLLKKDDSYSTYKEKINRTIFHDEAISKIIGDFGIREVSHNFDIKYENVGEIKVKGKIDNNYYCYKIEVDEISSKLKDYIEVSPFDLVNYNISELDKQVLYHIVLNEKFKIEM